MKAITLQIQQLSAEGPSSHLQKRHKTAGQRLWGIICPNLPPPSHFAGRFQGRLPSATGGGCRSRRLGSSDEQDVRLATTRSCESKKSLISRRTCLSLSQGCHWKRFSRITRSPGATFNPLVKVSGRMFATVRSFWTETMLSLPTVLFPRVTRSLVASVMPRR